jgi:cytochrome P450
VTHVMAMPSFISSMIQIDSFIEAEEILKSPAFVAGHSEPESRDFRAHSLLDLDGEIQFAVRRMHAPLFSRRAVQWYETNVFDPSIDRCLRELEVSRDSDGIVHADLAMLVRRILIQVTAAFVGIDDVETSDRTSLLERYNEAMYDATIVKWALPELSHEEVLRAGLRAKEGFLHDFFDPSLSRREALIVEGGDSQRQASKPVDDLLTIMLKHRDHYAERDLMVREAIVYLGSGVYTVGVPIIQAVEELDAWLRDHPDDRRRLADSEFLRRVTNEVLRFRFSIPGLVRHAITDATLSSGRQVHAGEWFSLRHGAMNHDPQVFGPDGDSFNPNRLVREVARPYALAFGSGPKICLAKPLVTSVTGPSEGEGEELDRVIVRILKALYKRGVEVDRDRPVVRGPSSEDRYDVFPVRFTRL